MAMSRCEARLKVTSLPSRIICPDVGNSRPAIILSVVVLPQPEGPSRQKNSPSLTVKVESLTAAKSPKLLCSRWTRISAIFSIRKLGDDREHHDAHQGGNERVAVEGQRERLEKHEHARTNHHAGEEL